MDMDSFHRRLLSAAVGVSPGGGFTLKDSKATANNLKSELDYWFTGRMSNGTVLLSAWGELLDATKAKRKAECMRCLDNALVYIAAYNQGRYYMVGLRKQNASINDTK